ncbi:RNA polymerase sigma factor, sigma-70 family [bacterium A37T11]|nr:RNA polymerase sigma factor, sigma-70 family [bacterium A37T11]
MTADTALWQQIIEGDQAAFKRLYEGMYPCLVRYARQYSTDESFIGECIQDLFINIWTKRDRLSCPSSQKHYLLRALRNIIYNKNALKSRMVYYGDAADLEALHADVEPTFEIHTDHLSPSLIQLLQTLTSRQKEAIYLYYVEDFSYQEIGQIFHIRTEAVYKLIYRALAALKTQSVNLIGPPD